MSDDALRAFAVATLGSDSDAALELSKERLEVLEVQGFTIYKKKVFNNARRPVTSERMTEALKMNIRAVYRAAPSLSMHQIAAMFNVNHGRVSEAINEK